MTPAESAVGRAWVAAHAAEFDEIQVQHEIGFYDPAEDRKMRLACDAETYLAWRRSTMAAADRPIDHKPGWRVVRNWVDIVGRTGAAYTLVEVKDGVRIRARKQILHYREEWLREYPATVVSQLVVAGRTCPAWLVRALTAEGIRVELFHYAD